MSNWFPIETIPAGQTVRVKTLTGIECEARTRNTQSGGIYFRQADGWGPKRAACVRTDGNSSGDIMAVSWKPLEEK